MANPNPERRARTRQSIIDAFWNLFEKHPLSSLKIKAITDKAGCNRSTFYEYFDSMRDLLDQAEDEIIDETCDYWREVIPILEQDETEQLAGAFYEAYGGKFHALMGPGGDPDFLTKLSSSTIDLFMDEFGLDPTDPVSELVITSTLGSISTTLVHWYENGKPVTAEELAAVNRKMITQGLWSFL